MAIFTNGNVWNVEKLLSKSFNLETSRYNYKLGNKMLLKSPSHTNLKNLLRILFNLTFGNIFSGLLSWILIFFSVLHIYLILLLNALWQISNGVLCIFSVRNCCHSKVLIATENLIVGADRFWLWTLWWYQSCDNILPRIRMVIGQVSSRGGEDCATR